MARYGPDFYLSDKQNLPRDVYCDSLTSYLQFHLLVKESLHGTLVHFVTLVNFLHLTD